MKKHPIKIFKMFIFPSRQAKEIRLDIESKSKMSKKSLLFNAINLYNNLPIDLKKLPVNTFKKQLKNVRLTYKQAHFC